MIDKKNYGLGTVCNSEQYDLPLRQLGTVQIECADRYLEGLSLSTVDAIKIDVQGFELDVLKGLRRTIDRWQPIIWLEISVGDNSGIDSWNTLASVFPYPISISRFAARRNPFFVSAALKTVDPLSEPLMDGNYLVNPLKNHSGSPSDWTASG